MNCIPDHGIILLDKPVDLTSRQCVSRVKRQMGKIKIGHAGTLDPFATGLLPICFGRTTKLVERIRCNPKTYHAKLKLGEATDTQDYTGTVVEVKPVPENLTLEQICDRASGFTGKQMQIPPMFSARKHNGKRLYELARQNIVVDRTPKEIEIYRFQVMRYESDIISFEVTCSEGTYVRTIGEDLAKALGTAGTLISLRRTQIGRFSIDNSIELERLESPDFDICQAIQKTETITADLRNLIILSSRESRFRNGMIMTNDDFQTTLDAVSTNEEFNIFSENGRFLGLGVVMHLENKEKWSLKTRRLIDIQRT